MRYKEIIQNNPFKNKWTYKFKLDLPYKVINKKIKYLNRDDWFFIRGILQNLRSKFGSNSYEFKGNIFYCTDLDVAYLFRILADKKILVIEKSTNNKENYEDIIY